ncbi:MAG: heavy metal translocating P-type ATPase [Spirochaetaceae bacterium]|jgi:Cd2+/Zn2+-exporting ATPase|nr:heavy metal translocating P-type ATPase [Spirochaetaceae bacterium]
MHELQLDGISCANCALKIEKALQENKKLSNVTLNFVTKKLVLQSDLKEKNLQDFIQIEVDKIEDGVTVDAFENEHKERQKVPFEIFKKHYKMFAGVLFLTAALLIDLTIPYQISAYIFAYVLIGGDIAFRALKNLLKGKFFDEYFLMTLATVGAFALGEFTEAVAVMLFYKIGEAFQEYAVDNSRRSIKSLLNIKAEYANLISENTTVKVTPDSLVFGDEILILAGEKVPVDGVIIGGESSLDTSALTGESMPRISRPDEEILSGFINLEAPLTVRVTKTFQNSAVSRILHMVENAAGKKAKTEQFITEFARIYTPIVVILALFIALIPPLTGFGDFREWLSRSLIFLVISCPCALVLSVPLGYFGGLGAASRQGILIKGGNYLEALNKINVYVFDKTGTLTKGNFAVQNVSGVNTLKLAAMLEQHSTHPIAKSIVASYGKQLNFTNISEIKEYPGLGLSCIYKKKELFVGNERLMEKFSINFIKDNYNGTVVHVAYDGLYEGAIEIIDEIKAGVKDLSRLLTSSGATDIVMLTGDQKYIAEKVSSELGIKHVYSELLPEDKLKHVETFISEGKKVLFAGDGINDAPVLARADIGVAMGGLGSDAAIEAADIVIMNDDPKKILIAKKIAKDTRRIVIQNIVFALSIKTVFLALGAMGFANMYEAIFADVGVALLAVLNSMRILKI